MRGAFSVTIVLLFCFVLPLVAHSDDHWKSSYTTKQSIQVFEKSKAKFFKNFDQEEFMGFLEDILDDYDVVGDDLERIKKDRHNAQRIRAAYNFLGARHEVPEDFDEFVVLFGKLKDALSAGVDPQPYAEELLEYLENQNLEQIINGFRPSSLRGVTSYARGRLEKMEEHALESEVSLKRFHKLRRGLRSFYFLIKFLKIEDAQTEALMVRLKDLNHKMGSIHDSLEEMKIRGEKVPETLPVPGGLSALIRDTRAQLFGKGRSCRSVLN